MLEFGKISRIETVAGEADEGVPVMVRMATLQDQAKARETALMSKMARESVEKAAEASGHEMRLVRVRYNFDRSVLRILFTAESHLDTRDMVKQLAGELRVRIDMRQIGVRDEAGIIGGMGPCGRQLCCCTWLQHFESVNVRMAKAQRLSLNTGAISGDCGRLKCCLRYEYEQYRELGRHLPRQGTSVETPQGKGRVIGRDILRQRLKVALEDERLVECSVRDVKEVWHRRQRKQEAGE